MKIIIGSDHGGFDIKEHIKRWIVKKGHNITDIGTGSKDSCDYTDFAAKAALSVSKNEFERGILVCGTGIGMSIASNKFGGVRAAVAWNTETAKLSREHNDANILCLPGRFLSKDDALAITEAWLDARFQGERHARRIEKIKKIEKDLLR